MTKNDYIQKNLKEHFQRWLFRVTIVGAGIFLSLSVLDYVSTPENFQRFLQYRIIIASILTVIAFASKKTRNMFSLHVLAYLAVLGSAITIELMIVTFGGHMSPYYVGMMLLGFAVVGFVPAGFSAHVSWATLIYATYLIPIVVVEEIADFQFFFTANFL